MLNIIKNIFSSKRSKLLKQISEKFGVPSEDVEYNLSKYRVKHSFYPDTHSDNEILELILGEDDYYDTIKTRKVNKC